MSPRAAEKAPSARAAKAREPRAPKPRARAVASEASAPPPREELIAVAREAVRTIPGLRAADLKKKLPKPLQPHHEEVRAILQELAAAGDVHRFVTAKVERFYAEDPIETLVRVVPEVLGKTGPLDPAALKRAVIAAAPGHEEPLLAWLKIAPTRGLLFEHAPARTPAGKKGPKRFGAAPDLDAVLAKALSELEKALEKTDAIGVPREQILDRLREKLGLRAPSAGQALTKQASTKQAPSGQPSSDIDIVREALSRLASEDRPGALLLIEDLRRRAPLDKPRFDAAVLDLSKQGRAVLHHHDHPAGLTEEERTALVHDGRGVYYHGIAPRSPS